MQNKHLKIAKFPQSSEILPTLVTLNIYIVGTTTTSLFRAKIGSKTSFYILSSLHVRYIITINGQSDWKYVFIRLFIGDITKRQDFLYLCR